MKSAWPLPIAFLIMVPPTMLPFVQAEEPATVGANIVRGVTLTNPSYLPDPILVKVGDTGRWTNNDATLHTVISGSPVSPDGKFGLNEDGGPIYIPPAGTFEYMFGGSRGIYILL